MIPLARFTRSCALRYAALLVTASGCITEATPESSVGSLRVSVSTNGDDLDLDGYAVQVDGLLIQTVGVIGGRGSSPT